MRFKAGGAHPTRSIRKLFGEIMTDPKYPDNPEADPNDAYPGVNIRRTRPDDGISYDRYDYFAYWLDDGDLEDYPDSKPDAINGFYADTPEDAIGRFKEHIEGCTENDKANRQKYFEKYGEYPQD